MIKLVRVEFQLLFLLFVVDGYKNKFFLLIRISELVLEWTFYTRFKRLDVLKVVHLSDVNKEIVKYKCQSEFKTGFSFVLQWT